MSLLSKFWVSTNRRKVLPSWNDLNLFQTIPSQESFLRLLDIQVYITSFLPPLPLSSSIFLFHHTLFHFSSPTFIHPSCSLDTLDTIFLDSPSKTCSSQRIPPPLSLFVLQRPHSHHQPTSALPPSFSPSCSHDAIFIDSPYTTGFPCSYVLPLRSRWTTDSNSPASSYPHSPFMFKRYNLPLSHT